MERVRGIGGLFFRAADAAGLGQWYARHLGVGVPGGSYDDEVWHQEAGPTVYAPFGSEHWDSPHLGPTGWGVNFRVGDLEAMVAQLRSAGVEVEIDPEAYPNGRFAQLHDPEVTPSNSGSRGSGTAPAMAGHRPTAVPHSAWLAVTPVTQRDWLHKETGYTKRLTVPDWNGGPFTRRAGRPRRQEAAG